MRKLRFILAVLIGMLVYGTWYQAMAEDARKGPMPAHNTASPLSQGYAGSVSCRECHERFYQLWSTSRHGLAMQPYTAAFAKARLAPQQDDVVIGGLRYRADLAKGVVSESGPKGMNQYKIEHALGGKNVYYFLTPFPGGRLQTLPIAYDVQSRQWFDTAASGVRHFPGTERGQQVELERPRVHVQHRLL